MRTKTKYRESKSDIPPVEEIPPDNIPQVEINGEAQEPVAAVSVEAEPEAVVTALADAAKVDEASAALKRQLDAIHQNEALKRQQAAQMAPQRPMSREEKLAMWGQQGASEAELNFLKANPELVDIPELTAFAANQASQQGHARNTEAHMEKTKAIFHEHLARMKAEAAEAEEAEETDRPMQQQPPAFFRPPPIKSPEPARVPVSAPVSREVPTGVPRELNPSQVKLSADEVEHAHLSGVDLKTYAENKLRLQKEKAAGMRQNG